jgi:hypothetical protein
MHNLRAFFEALRLTLRGETIQSPAERKFPVLFKWMKDGQAHLTAIEKHMAQANLSAAAAEQITIHVDGRDMSMKTVLEAVRYHLGDEYPYLLENVTDHSLTALYAANLNDQYWVQMLAQSDDLPESLSQPMTALSDHLSAIPSSTAASNSQT